MVLLKNRQNQNSEKISFANKKEKLIFFARFLLFLATTHPVDFKVKIKIAPSFSSVLRSRGDAKTRSRVNEIFLVAAFLNKYISMLTYDRNS